MKNTKKERERYFLTRISEIFPDFPIGDIRDSEHPDFIIEQDNRSIGIEIVDYIRGQDKGESAERRNEKLKEKVASTAKLQFETKHGIPLLVHIHWNPTYFLRRSEIPQIVSNLVRVIEQHIPSGVFEAIEIDSPTLFSSPLKDLISFVIINRVRTEKQSLWSFISSGWIEVQPKEIQYLLDMKNEKVLDYLHYCDEVWLIIVADGSFITSNIDVSDNSTNHCYTTNFKKVLVYDHIGKYIFELKKVSMYLLINNV